MWLCVKILFIFIISSKVYSKSLCEDFLVSKKIVKNLTCGHLEEDKSLEKLEDYINKIKVENLENLSAQFKKRLREFALKETLLKRQQYLGLAYNLPGLNEELLQCGKSHSYANKDKRSFFESLKRGWEYSPSMGGSILDTQKKFNANNVNLQKRKDIITLDYMNALKINRLFQENKDYESQVQKANLQYNSKYKQCNYYRLICNKGQTPRSEKYQCGNIDKCFQDADEKKENTLTLLNKKRKPLLDMVATSPILFNNTDEGDVLSAFQSSDLKPSSTMNNIINHISPDLIKKYNSIEPSEVDTFLDKNLSVIRSDLLDIKNDQKFNKEYDNELTKELERLDQAALALCNGEGENLHHYENLVSKTLSSLFKEGSKRGESELNLAMGQAAYCHLMDNDPPNSDRMSGVEIGAFALLGVGFALQVIPGVGNIAGAGLIASGMAITGGSVLTGFTVKEIYDENQKLNTEIALHSGGLYGYEKLMNTRDERNSLVRWGAADIALLGIDLKLLSKLKSISNSRRYDTDRRKSLDQLEAQHGGPSQTQNVMNKYFPGNSFNISKADQIYINSLSKMIEDDILKALKSKSENRIKTSEELRVEVEKETKEVLESIVRKCNR